MAEPKGFFEYNAESRSLSRAGFKFRPGDPEGEDYQPPLQFVLTDDDVLVRRRDGAGSAFVYLPVGDEGALVRDGELFLLPKASADELLNHPTLVQWLAVDAAPKTASPTKAPENRPNAPEGPKSDKES